MSVILQVLLKMFIGWFCLVGIFLAGCVVAAPFMVLARRRLMARKGWHW